MRGSNSMIESHSLPKKTRRSSTRTCMRPVERSFTQKHLAVRPRVIAFSPESPLCLKVEHVEKIFGKMKTCRVENMMNSPLKIPTSYGLSEGLPDRRADPTPRPSRGCPSNAPGPRNCVMGTMYACPEYGNITARSRRLPGMKFTTS